MKYCPILKCIKTLISYRGNAIASVKESAKLKVLPLLRALVLSGKII